jgi:hypothetical protein
VHTALVQSFEATTSAFENMRAALDDHVPETILWMLVISAAVGAFALGRVQGIDGGREIAPTAIYMALAGVAVWVTLDLEQPRSGAVRLPIDALESVQESLHR